jgi:hypothetical protein
MNYGTKLELYQDARLLAGIVAENAQAFIDYANNPPQVDIDLNGQVWIDNIRKYYTELKSIKEDEVRQWDIVIQNEIKDRNRDVRWYYWYQIENPVPHRNVEMSNG